VAIKPAGQDSARAQSPNKTPTVPLHSSAKASPFFGISIGLFAPKYEGQPVLECGAGVGRREWIENTDLEGAID
jgi:hypothetical protein